MCCVSHMRFDIVPKNICSAKHFSAPAPCILGRLMEPTAHTPHSLVHASCAATCAPSPQGPQLEHQLLGPGNIDVTGDGGGEGGGRKGCMRVPQLRWRTNCEPHLLAGVHRRLDVVLNIIFSSCPFSSQLPRQAQEPLLLSFWPPPQQPSWQLLQLLLPSSSWPL